MPIRRFLLILLIAAVAAAASLPKASDEKQTVARYYELRERTLDQRGTKRDVEELLALFADGAKFEHPRVGVSMTVDEARSGLLAHLREGERKSTRLNSR